MKPTFEEAATYGLALVILLCSFYGLLREGDSEIRVIFGGLIGAVTTWLFQERATRQATKHTIDAQNNGLDGIQKTVTRIENGRTPTLEEKGERDGNH